MSDELVHAMREQSDALRQTNAVKATDIALQNARAANAEAKWLVTTRTNLRTNALSFSAKLNAQRTVEDVIADAEKMLSWLEMPLAELNSDDNS